METLPAIAVIDTDMAERSSDPAEFVMVACERAKAWLAEILADGAIEQIVEMKSQAEAIRVYTVQKNLGKDAELAAAEIVRRAERGIGVAIRRGQEEGTIARKGQRVDRGDNVIYPIKEFLPAHEWIGQSDGSGGIRSFTDGVDDAQFEEAITEAKEERNLSRANVVRKIKHETPAEPRNEYHRNRRHIDHHRVLNETIAALEGMHVGLRLIDLDAIPDTERAEWATRIRDAVRPITKFAREVSA